MDKGNVETFEVTLSVTRKGGKSEHTYLLVEESDEDDLLGSLTWIGLQMQSKLHTLHHEAGKGQ